LKAEYLLLIIRANSEYFYDILEEFRKFFMKKVSKKTKREIAFLKEGGKILSEALLLARALAKEGAKRIVTGKDLEDLVVKFLLAHKADPAFLNYQGAGGKPYPSALCVSVNSELVHGLATKEKIICSGDLVKLDLGVKYKNLFTDAALSVPVGECSLSAIKMAEAAEGALKTGIEQIYPGSTLGNYGYAVEKYILQKGFFVVKDLVGHGVGYAVHEPPQVLNYGKAGQGLELEEGMVLALEPMLNEIDDRISLASDGFTYVASSGGLTSHWEKTVAVTREGVEILTVF